MLRLLAELRPVVGFDIHATFEGPVDSTVPDRVLEHLLAVVREAVTNVGRHAKATSASVFVGTEPGRCMLRVTDDGRGMDASDSDSAPGSASGGLGLSNLRRRAEKLHGTFDMESPPSGGTVLIWQVPIDT